MKKVEGWSGEEVQEEIYKEGSGRGKEENAR